jgi:hypothetical protein
MNKRRRGVNVQGYSIRTTSDVAAAAAVMMFVSKNSAKTGTAPPDPCTAAIAEHRHQMTTWCR